jgi:hypothetical protein
MSLDISLKIKKHVSEDECKTWEEIYEEVYRCNITHNLGKMASEAGIYEALWRPYRLRDDYIKSGLDEEYEYESRTVILAQELIPYLEKGLEDLEMRPEHFEKWNSPNGWGTYINFVSFVCEYLQACKEYPKAVVFCCR